jgi:hypothetical protein
MVISEDDSTAWIIGNLEESGLEIADEDVVVVLEVEADYYRAIGMFGPEVADAQPNSP